MEHENGKGGLALVSELIDDHSLTTVKRMGNIVELQALQHINLDARIRILKNHRYMVIATGEVFDMTRSVKKSDNVKSLRKTFRRLRERINSNFSGSANELFVTLTFDSKLGTRPYLGDVDLIRRRYKDFVRRMKRKFGSELVFIKVIEPHADGHAHLHVLIKFLGLKHVFIQPDEFRSYWRWGFVKVHKILGNTNVGAYLTAYLTDVELNNEALVYMVAHGCARSNDVVIKNGKKFIKGGRLHYYPRDFHLFTCSRNAKFPVVSRERKMDIKKELSAGTLSFSKQYDVEIGSFSNTIQVESYVLPD